MIPAAAVPQRAWIMGSVLSATMPAGRPNHPDVNIHPMPTKDRPRTPSKRNPDRVISRKEKTNANSQ